MEEITSRSNPLMAHLRRLGAQGSYRRECGEFLCEGPKMLAEALAAGCTIPVVCRARSAPALPRLPEQVRQVQLPDDLLSWVAPTQNPQQMIFTCAFSPVTLPETLPRGEYLVLDGLQDPGNVGSIWRSADALEAKGIILLPGCADPYAPKTLRATMGACFRLPLWEARAEQLAKTLWKGNIPLVAAALTEDSRTVGEMTLPQGAVVIGSEGHGVSQEVLSLCQGTWRIPMSPRCESLNAAAAAAILLWEMRTARGKEPEPT